MRYQHPFAEPNGYDASDPFYTDPAAERHHLGSDYIKRRGVPFGAICGGTVVEVSSIYFSSVGWITGVQYDDGMFGGYFHQDARPPLALGQRLERGQAIGVEGASGSVATGAHLHISLGYTHGAIFGLEPLVDPYAYIRAHLTDASGEKVTPLPNKITQQRRSKTMKDQGLIRNSETGDIAAVFVLDGKTVKSKTLNGTEYGAWVAAGYAYANVSPEFFKAVPTA